MTHLSLAGHLLMRQAITAVVVWLSLWTLDLIIPILPLNGQTRSSLMISLSAGWTLTWCQTSGLARALEDLGLRVRRAQRVIWTVTALASLVWALCVALMTESEVQTLHLTIPHGPSDEAVVELCVSKNSQMSLTQARDARLRRADECVTQPWRIPGELKRADRKARAEHLRRAVRIERPSGARVEIISSDAAVIYRATARSRRGASRVTAQWLAHLSLVLLFGLWLRLGYAPRASLVIYIGLSLALEALGSAVL